MKQTTFTIALDQKYDMVQIALADTLGSTKSLAIGEVVALIRELQESVTVLADRRKRKLEEQLARLQQEIAGLSDIKAVVRAEPEKAPEPVVERQVEKAVQRKVEGRHELDSEEDHVL